MAKKIFGFQTVDSTVNQWGNGLAIRLNKTIANAAGAAEGSSVRVSAKPGKIIIDVRTKTQSLDEMLALFDPKKHGGEVMAFEPIGKELG